MHFSCQSLKHSNLFLVLSYKVYIYVTNSLCFAHTVLSFVQPPPYLIQFALHCCVIGPRIGVIISTYAALYSASCVSSSVLLCPVFSFTWIWASFSLAAKCWEWRSKYLSLLSCFNGLLSLHRNVWVEIVCSPLALSYIGMLQCQKKIKDPCTKYYRIRNLFWVWGNMRIEQAKSMSRKRVWGLRNYINSGVNMLVCPWIISSIASYFM